MVLHRGLKLRVIETNLVEVQVVGKILDDWLNHKSVNRDFTDLIASDNPRPELGRAIEVGTDKVRHGREGLQMRCLDVNGCRALTGRD